KDPVCGMTVDRARAAATREYKGKTYYFCARSCAEKFSAQPEAYLEQARASRPHPHGSLADQEIWYFCPMHPEVRQLGPGSCPKCGMALEAELTSAAGPDDSELRDMTRRLWVSAALAV